MVTVYYLLIQIQISVTIRSVRKFYHRFNEVLFKVDSLNYSCNDVTTEKFICNYFDNQIIVLSDFVRTTTKLLWSPLLRYEDFMTSVVFFYRKLNVLGL